MERPLRVWVIGKSAWLLAEKSGLAHHREQQLTQCAIEDVASCAGTATSPCNPADPLEHQRNEERLRDLEPIDPRD